MKKNNFLTILALAALLAPTVVFATEIGMKEAAEEALAPEETSSQQPLADELSKVAPASPEEILPESEVKSAPLATVSDAEKGSDEGLAAKTETSAPKAAREISKKKNDEAPTRKETSSALNTAEMRRRWKALFSKEITPDSIAYTVKSGDSLYVLAKKNHTTVDLIKQINDLKSDDIYPRMKLKIHTAPFSIRIDKSKNELVLYSNDEPVKRYSVATGKKNCTPTGEFKITDKLVHPTWFKTGAILPPGSPENALGTRWMGFDKPSYGIHGTIEPKSIGTQASEGCVRMLNEEVEELYSIVPVGTSVTIQD